MEFELTPITGFAEAIAAQRPSLFEPAVKVAYQAGADVGTLLLAVDVARHLADVPAPLVAHAYATVHRWSWIPARRKAHPPPLVPHAA